MQKVYNFFNLNKIKQPSFIMWPGEVSNKRFYFDYLEFCSMLKITFNPKEEDRGKTFIF